MIGLTQMINDINNDNSAKVIVLTHDIETTKVFSSGHDLNEMYRNINNKPALVELFKVCNTLMMTVHHSSIPIIAMVNGICTAAGCELVLSCDMVMCTKASSFQTPGVHIGTFCHTPSVQLSRAVYSKKHSMQLLLTGDPVDAQTAHRMGFVNFVCDDVNALLAKTEDIALKICTKSKSVVAFGKESYLKHSKEKYLQDAYKIASKNMVDNLMNYADSKEGISAFLNKRTPNWTNVTPSKL